MTTRANQKVILRCHNRMHLARPMHLNVEHEKRIDKPGSSTKSKGTTILQQHPAIIQDTISSIKYGVHNVFSKGLLPKAPGIYIKPTLGPKVSKCNLPLAMSSPRVLGGSY